MRECQYADILEMVLTAKLWLRVRAHAANWSPPISEQEMLRKLVTWGLEYADTKWPVRCE